MGEPTFDPPFPPTGAASGSDAIYGLPTGANRSLSELIDPDDWRLFHIMRELANDDRHRIVAFAEMLFSLKKARAWAEAPVASRQSSPADRA